MSSKCNNRKGKSAYCSCTKMIISQTKLGINPGIKNKSRKPVVVVVGVCSAKEHHSWRALLIQSHGGVLMSITAKPSA